MQSNGGITLTETELLNLSMMNSPRFNRLKISHPPSQISLKENPPKELAEICKYAAQACQAASASASGKGKSPASSEGSTTEMINLSQFSAPVKKNWYEESLFQDAQDPYAGIEEDQTLIEEQYLG
uniref:Uncharacterized protein n=1 Tax=Fagus sylvatica TaxID=28930 RepID=A0A2N9G0H9_FAGSY